MSSVALWKLFHRGRNRNFSATSVLAVIAFAAASALFLTVLGGVHAFVWRASTSHRIVDAFSNQSAQGGEYLIYVVLSLFASMLLLIPFASLSASAARLAAARRDARLSALRLAGATSGQVSRLTALEAAGQALLGSALGMVGYVALIPAIMLIPFQNSLFSFQELWVGPTILLIVAVAMTSLALISALSALMRVVVTPLGVSARVTPPALRKWRLLVFLGVMIGAVALMKTPLSKYFSQAVAIAIFFAVIALCFALINLIGPWVIAMRARMKVRRPRNVATLLAMRRILDNPKRAWRNVSGIALAVFISGITSICAYIGSSVQQASAQDAMLLKDIGTGGIVTLVFSAVLAAVSCGVMQAGNVYDQSEQYRMLMLEGADRQTMSSARRIEVMTPLRVVVAVSAGSSMVLMLPIFGSAMAQPWTLVAFLAGIILCFVLVGIGVAAANRVSASISLVGARSDD
ncbi:MAG: ABC transporter permease [Bifidobacterium sp.]|jgi:hypothetical protein|nr:ABC transporter permease [Bifidobacterium sp.]MCH4175623.1 ABC transporter permease [Bifidobacterium sp.]